MSFSRWILSLILSVMFTGPAVAGLKPGEAIRALPIQADGRVKPYDTFAREMLEIVYGKGKIEGVPATQIILTWMITPSAWEGRELFEIRNHEVLAALNLDKSRKHFRGEEVFANERFTLLRQELQEKRESKEKLTPYFQALQRLENQFFIFSEMATGRLMKVAPAPNSSSWKSVSELEGELQAAFADLASKFLTFMAGTIAKEAADVISVKAKTFDDSVLNFQALAEKQNPAAYENKKIMTEIHYNDFHPFRWAYILYILAAVVLLYVWTMKQEKLMIAAWSLVVVGLALHTYGFGVRVYLTERPPVSNMYETVVWSAWGALVFSIVLELVYRFKFILLAGTLAAFVGMVIADAAPAVLDPSLQPLEAVLRSNYWLIVHVMTITISYAAFLLAFILGDIGLVHYLRGEEKNKEKIKELSLAIYRAKQIGVVFLAPGIILGGIWADASWGRFWGWDPKETWALIVLLGYIAVLHGRLVGWIKDFGMVVSGVLTFSLVVMAWYGVNFVLGAGLHTYGFGAGGIEYIGGFVLAHILAIVYIAIVRESRSKTSNQISK